MLWDVPVRGDEQEEQWPEPGRASRNGASLREGEWKF